MNYDVIKIEPGELDYIFRVLHEDSYKLYKYEIIKELPLPRIALEYDVEHGVATEYYDFDSETEVLSVRVEYPKNNHFSFDIYMQPNKEGLLAFHEPDFDPARVPSRIKEFLLTHYTDDLVKDVPNWMGFVGRFINVNRFLKEFKPEEICKVKVKRQEPSSTPHHNSKKKHKPNKVKTYKVYRFVDDLEGAVKEHIQRAPNNRYCEAWGVRGHYRHYKDGKTVWVKACIKGKSRDKYAGKEYELFEHVKEN